MQTEVIQFIDQHYALDQLEIEADLTTWGQRKALLLNARQGRYVVKICEAGRSESVVQSDVGILAYLAKYAFPAPHLLKTRAGEDYLAYGDSFLHIYTFIEGRHPRPDPDFMYRAGQCMARLHNLPYDGYGKASTYQPAALIDEVKASLNRALTTDQRELAFELLQDVDALPAFEGLPVGLIHTDPYLVNWISDNAGQLYLIDWDDAGIGLPLLDAAYCVANLSTYPRHEAERWDVPVEGSITWRKDWAGVFLEGYQSERRLGERERQLFAAAIKLNVLAYIWDWSAERIIEGNVERMRLLESFELP